MMHMTSTILKTSDCDRLSAKELGVFLADYGARLLASGATCIRIDRNVGRMARAAGMTAEMTVMPRHIHLTVLDPDSGEMLTSIAAVPATGINFTVNAELSRLSWEIADGKVSLRQAIDRYRAIVGGGSKSSRWAVTLLVAVANASFCRLFGGDLIAMVIVGVAALAGYYLKDKLLARKMDSRPVFIICSLVSAVIGSTDMLFSIGTTREIALSTSVLYLVPGIPLLNSFSDMLYRRYLCAFARFADAVILTCCLSIGLLTGMLLMQVSLF